MTSRKPRDHYYKRDPERALRGFAALTDEQCGIYAKLIELTYARGRPPEDDDKSLAKMIYTSTRVWKRVKEQLVKLGRIRVEDGFVIDDACLEVLAQRARDREEAVEKGSEGGKKSAAARREVAKFRETSGESSGINSEFHRADVGENKDLAEGGLNQVESEVESGTLLNLDSILKGDDLTCVVAGPLPPIDDDSPLGQISAALGNLVPLGSHGGAKAPRFADPRQVQLELIASAGPRLDREAVKNSIGVIALAMSEGCDADMDMLPAVIERTHGDGGPIPTWRYFEAIWRERRDTRLRQQAAKVAGATVAKRGAA